MDALAKMHALTPGQIIGDRFRLRRLLAEGGMGAVYEAEHIELGRRVALKVLLGSFGHDPTVVARFQREARTASSIGHPNIVKVLDLGRMPDGSPYLVMEFLEGEDLEAPLERGETLDLEAVCDALEPVASALDEAHARGVFHRDIKPANIFKARTAGGEVIKLVDFGLAALRDADEKLTKLNMVMGTPHYMAPEAAEGAGATAAADVYSLAAVAFELLTGNIPHDADSVMGILTAKVTETAPRVSDVTVRPLPKALDAIFADALSRDVARRPRSASALMKRLRAVALRESAPPSLEVVRVRRDREARSTEPTLAVAVPETPLPAPLPPAASPRPIPAQSTSGQSTSAQSTSGQAPRRRTGLIAAIAIGLLLAGSGVAWAWTTRTPAAPAVPPRADAGPAAPSAEAAPERVEPEAVAPEAEPETLEPETQELAAQAPRPRVRRPRPAARQPAAAPAEEPETPAAAPRVAPAPSAHVEALLTQAQQALLRGRLGAAERLYREASYADSRRAEAWRGLGLTYERLGRQPEAARAYRRFLRVAPGAPEAGAVRGRLQRLDG